MSFPPLARRRVEEYWSWFAVGLFLLLPVDLLTTYGAAAEYGLAHEANPVMRWLLPKGVVVTTVVHLCLVVVAVAGFRGVLVAIERTPARLRPPLLYGLELWLGLLIVAGLIVLANNLSVIVFGDSLLLR